MKTFLMFPDHHVDLGAEEPSHAGDLAEDLEVATLVDAMAAGDPFVAEVARHALLASLDAPDEVRYRQAVLTDALANPNVAREMYAIASEAAEGARRSLVWRGRTADTMLHTSVSTLRGLVPPLRRLASIARTHAAGFESAAFTALFDELTRELTTEYFDEVEEHLRQLRFRDGVRMSAGLGKGNQTAGHVLRRPNPTQEGWLARVLPGTRPGYSFQIPDRDEAAAKALSQLQARGLAPAAVAVAESAQHILGYFQALRTELAFYIGCINLHERLTEHGQPTCLPTPRPRGTRAFAASRLYDPCLSLAQRGAVVGNDVNADGKPLIMVTGANQGGKSTFLRSVGLAQLMMQAGMLVAADSFTASVGSGVYTHFTREEDAAMRSGKLDEELGRMSDLADVITADSLMLFNESFASTNEREGSEIARHVVRAMTDAGVTTFFVTHLYDLAESLHAEQRDTTLFLRAERHADGRRTFQLTEGTPQATSHGKDLFTDVFGRAG